MGYKWTWGWHAVTSWKPADKFFITEEELNEWIKEKVAQKLVSEYIKKGYKISVDDVVTTATLSAERKPHRIYGRVKRYTIDAETTTRFDTDAPVFSSPIDPATASVIVAVIGLITAIIVPAFYFAMFMTTRNTLLDIGTGISEALGLPGEGKAGLGILFVGILLIIGLWVIGKYFWRKRR